MPKDRTDYRFLYASEQVASQKAYDKTLLALSSGAFAITFAFLEGFVSGPPNCPIIIILGWAFLSVSIVCQLASHLMSYNAFKQAISDLDTENDNPDLKFSKATDGLNYLSMAMFAVGMLLILVFVYLNF